MTRLAVQTQLPDAQADTQWQGTVATGRSFGDGQQVRLDDIWRLCDELGRIGKIVLRIGG